jgi:hypothetical protein
VLRLFVICIALAVPRLVLAHQTSVKYVDIAFDGKSFAVVLRCASSDVTEPMGLPSDAQPSVAEALAHPGVPAYVQTWLVLRGCSGDPPAVKSVDDKFIAVTWTATCARTEELALDFGALFALDARQEVIVQLSAPGTATVNTIVRADQTQMTLRPGHSPSLLAWIRTGMAHIYEGVDHICFVLALLLVVMLVRGGGAWRTRGFVPTLRSTAIVITAFTIAHSITLIAAALGYVELPSGFVEAVIALSIAYTAGEDIAKPDVRWRFALTFGFGLIHGLGFAGTLAGLLPPSDVVVPLLCFNVGVELGQLTIVLLALPVFYGVARVAGGDRYRTKVLPLLAGIILLLGLTMFVERILGVRILPM